MDPNQHREFAYRGLSAVVPLPRHRVGRHHIFRIGVVTSDVPAMLDYALAADFDLFALLMSSRWLYVWCADREVLARAEAALQSQKDTTRTDVAPFTPSCPTAECIFLPVSGVTAPNALLARLVAEVRTAFDAEVSGRTPQPVAPVQPMAAPTSSAPATADVRITIKVEQDPVRVQVRDDRGPIFAPMTSSPVAAPAAATPPSAPSTASPTNAPMATAEPAPRLVRFTPPVAATVIEESADDIPDEAEEIQDDGRAEDEENAADHAETQPIPAVVVTKAPPAAPQRVEPKGVIIKTLAGTLGWRCQCGLSFEGKDAVAKHKQVPHTVCPGCNGVVPEERLSMHQAEPHFLCGECGAPVLLENRTRHLQTRCGARPQAAPSTP